MYRLNCCVAVAVAGLGSQAVAGIINVGPGQSIQAAINIALNGDEIVVAPGTYVGNLHIEAKLLTLRSSDGPNVTIIRPTGEANPLLRLTNLPPGSLIQGFTFTSGLVSVQRDLIRFESGSVTITDCVVTESQFRGLTLDGGDATVSNCTFSDLNITSSPFGGGIDISTDNAVVINCSFLNNSTINGGSGIIVSRNATITNCLFVGNTTSVGSGGGIYITDSAAPAITNCVFSGNDAALAGGAIYSKGSNAVLTSCTFNENSAALGGGLFNEDFSFLTLTNCILWGNTPFQIYDLGALTTVSFSDIEGGWDYPGSHDIIDADPMFVDAGNDDLRLLPGSPCIDAGDNTAVPADELDLDGDSELSEPLPFDLDSNPRFFDDTCTVDSGIGDPPVVDMGAYEFQGVPGDIDGLCSVSVPDLLLLLAAWGPCPGPPDPCPADIDLDGTVGVPDLMILLANWG